MFIKKEMDCQTNHGLNEAKPLSMTENWRDLDFIWSAGTFSVNPEEKVKSVSLSKREQAQEMQPQKPP